MKQFLISRIKSFGYAFTGLSTLIKSEQNTWIHLLATLIIVIAGLIKNINKMDWCFIIIAIGLVWMTEAFNTALEKLCDKIDETYHPLIKQVKDISAAAVLIAAIIAVLIGGFVFIL